MSEMITRPRTDKERVDAWKKRWESAKHIKDTWEKKYTPAKCFAYYTGDQYRSEERKDENGDERLSINRVGAAIRAALPSLMFYHPFVRVVGAPEREDTPGQNVDSRAQLLQDTVNSIVRDPATQFMEQTYLAVKEAQWAFGCVEVGYSAKFEDTPTATRPPLMESVRMQDQGPVDQPLPGAPMPMTGPAAGMITPMTGMTGPTLTPMVDGMLPGVPAASALPVAPPIPKVEEENFFVRYVPANSVMVSRHESSILKELDWVGYFDWMYLSDIQASPAYSAGAEGLKSTPVEKSPDDDQLDMVKIYKIWDLRTKTKRVWAENHDKFLLEEKFDRLPLFFLRFECEPGRFFPIPPIYHMLKPQDEYNQSRDLLRRLRKCVVPRYTYDEAALRPEDIEKFESGDPGVYIPIRNNNMSPINPVSQPPMSDTAIRTLAMAGQEFTELSGISPESRQVAQSETATQAQLVNQKQAVQDSYDRWLVANFFAEISKELLQRAISDMILPRWIKINSDQFSPMFPQDSQQIAALYRQITFQDLQEANSVVRWEVTVDVESISPASQQEKQTKWNMALQMMANPAIARILALSPELLKHTLDLNGLHSAQEQRLIGEALQKEATMQLQMAMQAGKPAPQQGVTPLGGGHPQGGPPAAPAPAGPPESMGYK